MSVLPEREDPRWERIPWKGLGCEPLEWAIDLRKMTGYRKPQSRGGTEIGPGTFGDERKD
jgi:hypothetical protein